MCRWSNHLHKKAVEEYEVGFKVKLTKEEAEEKFRQYEELFSICAHAG